jgi:glutamate dehydrogenase/leucine dehydrogenase/CBS domain-containing protein
MIPQAVAECLARLPREEVEQRLVRDGERRYVELGPEDGELRLRLGVETDKLGPARVVVLWDEPGGTSADDLPVGGYLVVDNLAMGCPSLGGIRLAPDVTPATIASLARGMTMKNAAADIPFGGGKAGIVADGAMPPERKRETVRRYARLIARYAAEYNPGPDVGMDDEDMGLLAIEIGLDSVVSKPARMGGTEIDESGATAGGVVAALETVLARAGELAALPQFQPLLEMTRRDIRVIVQGFGAVGANTALLLHRRAGPYRYRVVGLSDSRGFLYGEGGLDVPRLVEMARGTKTASHKYYLSEMAGDEDRPIKFSNARDDLLRESAEVLIPAAPVANYIGLDTASDPSMVLDRIGRWQLIVEGANTYSAAREKRAEKRSIERILYRERGTLIATDYLTNSGGVIYAAHEKLVPTPPELRFPAHVRGDPEACERWLADHAEAFARLAERRRTLARARRDEVIERNMGQLVRGLVEDRTLLPCDVAEQIAKARIETQRTIDRLMTAEYVTVPVGVDIQAVADTLKATSSEAALVLSEQGALAGIITRWDIVLAVANRLPPGSPAREVMTREVVTVQPHESVVDVMPLARRHGYSVMPVVDDARRVVGVIRLQDLIEI